MGRCKKTIKKNNKMNKKIIVNAFVFFIITILISSCAIQKRRYMSGYHVEYGKNKNHQPTQSEQKEEAEIVENEKEVEKNNDDESLTASSDNEIKIIERNNLDVFFNSSKIELNKSIESNKEIIKNVKHKIKKQSNRVKKKFKEKSTTAIGILSLIFLAIGVMLLIVGLISLASVATEEAIAGMLFILLAIPFILLALVFGAIWGANKDKN